MRLGLILLGFTLAMGITRSAAAESRRVDPSWAAPAVRVALLDSYRHAAQAVPFGERVSRSEANAGERDAEPGQALTQAVERMWSQVRAYHRPGGAEVFIRGKF